MNNKRLSLSILALILILAFSGTLLAASSPFEKPMKAIGKAMKAIKTAVASGDMKAVKENAEFIAETVVTVKTFEPPINKDKKALIPERADHVAEAAKALAASASADEAKDKYQELGKNCKACHDTFQPPD